MFRSLPLFVVAAAGLAAPIAVQAQSFGLDVGVASQYVGKGLGKSDQNIAPFAKTRVSAAVANRMADGGVDYNAWNVGAKHKLTDAFAVDLRWYDTDHHSVGEPYEGRLIAAATYSF